jgi:hypothetical protein
MSTSAGPSTPVTDLIFYFDSGNTEKSWKGKPTTNLYTGTSLSAGDQDGFGGGSYLDTNLTSLSPFNAETVTARKSNSGVATWSVTANLTAGITYTYSIWCKTIGQTTVNLRRNEPGTYLAESKAVSVSPGVWARVSFTFTVNTGKSGSQVVGINVGDANAGQPNPGIFLYGAQLEQNSFLTPYTLNTRTDTTALLDLTGRNTITATSLTYNSSGTFSFNGSSNFVIFPENSAFNTQTPTVEVWVKTNATTQNGFWFEKGQVNTQYALFQESTSITWRHTTNVGSLTAPAASYINTSQYAQVVGTYTAGDRRLYVNGVQVAADALNYTLPTNANGCSIGVYGGFNGSRGYYYNGDIAIVKVYNRALSAAEVQQNFNSLRSRFGL